MRTLIRHRAAMLAATALLVVAADRLFAGIAPGWPVGVVILLLLGLTGWRHPALVHEPRARRVAVLTVVLALTCAIGDSWPTPLLAGATLLSLVLMARGGLESDARLWLGGLLAAVVRIPLRALWDRQLVQDWRRRHAGTSGWRRVIGPWLAPLALGGGFIAIFACANPVIEGWLGGIGDWLLACLVELPDLPTPARFLLWLGMALGCWAILRLRRRHPGVRIAYRDLVVESWYRKPDLVIRCLLVVNAVFALQTLMDAAYLLGGAHLPAGMSHATYAHRGAYPLLVATLVSAGMVLTVFQPGGAAQARTWARRLAVLWLVQNVALVCAAGWRLHLYVDVYSLTAWRLAAAVWMLLVAVGLVLIVWRIATRRGNRWLINANALATVAVLVLGCAVDSDRLIAWHNVRHCAEVGAQALPVDLDYLDRLGPTTAPALHWLAVNSRDPAVVRHSDRMAQLRDRHLHLLLRDVRTWTWWRWSALPAVDPAVAMQEQGHGY